MVFSICINIDVKYWYFLDCVVSIWDGNESRIEIAALATDMFYILLFAEWLISSDCLLRLFDATFQDEAIKIENAEGKNWHFALGIEICKNVCVEGTVGNNVYNRCFVNSGICGWVFSPEDIVWDSTYKLTAL